MWAAAGMFKVPSSRNVSKTGPWFRDEPLRDARRSGRAFMWDFYKKKKNDSKDNLTDADKRDLRGLPAPRS